eukprot:6778815-Lingulodinium_polyedra.AAC.1
MALLSDVPPAPHPQRWKAAPTFVPHGWPARAAEFGQARPAIVRPRGTLMRPGLSAAAPEVGAR